MGESEEESSDYASYHIISILVKDNVRPRPRRGALAFVRGAYESSSSSSSSLFEDGREERGGGWR